ncbi:MAG: phosphate regulon sensor histidine kinase PhoR [Desulfovibrionaceae bacterium]|jgi:two-component system phosphate regulon sensor histidine kinase PhoR|nr:phosphate regulon sensor histidine kinase PhoR [Desulfovibrionaceae bacterium]
MRILVFVLVQAVPGLLGWLWQGWPGAAAGVAGGSVALLALDAWHGRRFMRWLRAPESSPPPALRGLWREAAHRVARALREERERGRESARRLDDFLAAIQASPDGVILLDAEGRIEWCNGMASRHLGIDPRRDLLQHIGNLVRDPAFAAHLAGRDGTAEVALAGRDHTPAQPVRLSVQMHPYGAGHRLMLSRDVTALVQSDAMRRNFVANVSHELRTPLTVLAGFVETMQSLPLAEDERARYLDLMAGQSARMKALIDDLLTLSRLEGSPPPGADQADLPALMAQCEAEARALSNLLHPSAEPAQRLRFAELPGFALTGAAHELRSAISNLVNNAVRYTPAGGAIDVAWQRLPDGGARLSVADTGPGIAPEHLSRLSERFYRVDHSRARASGGTGLGLAIVKHVAQRHGGELQISSVLGHGSCFALALPAQRVRELNAATAP